MGKKYIITESQEKFLIEQSVSSSKLLNTDELDKFEGKSVNLYKDKGQQEFHQKIFINEMRLENKPGGGQQILIWINERLLSPTYYIPCLTNPDRLADFVSEWDGVKEVRYFNSSFTTSVKQAAVNFCKKPSASYGSEQKLRKNNIS